MELDPKTLRAWGRLLATLLQTPDDELADFAQERLEGAAVPEAALKRGRDLLVHVGRALESPDAQRWTGIEMAADTLDHWERGIQQSAGTAPAPPAAAEALATAAGAAAPAVPTPSSDMPGPRVVAADPSPWAPQAARPAAASDESHAAPKPLAPMAAASPPAAPRAATPPPAPPEPARASPSTPPPREASEAGPELSELATTIGLAAGQPAETALPFKGQAMAPPAVVNLAEKHDGSGATAPGGRKGGPTMPFKAVPAQHPDAAVLNRPPILTLKQYAAFCTERSRWPLDVDGHRTRFGLSEDSESHADAYYTTVFASDRSQRQKWLELCQAHQKKLDERG